MSEAVTLLLDNFYRNRRDYGRRLAEMLEKDPPGFREAAVQYLCRGGHLPSEQILVWLLQKANMLLDILLDPATCSLDQAVQLAKVVKRNADRIDVELARQLKEASNSQASRILRLLAEIADSNRTLPLLIKVLRESRSELRGMAALIFARHCQNTLFIENAMKDSDAGVRASAIEGLGLSNRRAEPAILLDALYDPSPRVRANAALARYRFGDKSALRLLTEMAGQEEPEARTMAAWAMGETQDARCIALLENRRTDSSQDVRDQVDQALTKIRLNRGPDETPTPEQPITFDLLSASVDTAGNRRFHMALTTPDGSEFIDFSEHHFSMEEDGVVVTDRQVRTPSDREPLHLAFVLDCSGSIAADEIQRMNAAVVRSLQEKLPKDKAAVFKFSLDVERALGFTGSLNALASVVRRRHPGLKTASRLHDAIGQALEDLRPQPGFRAVIVIADGSDRGSEIAMPALIERIKTTGIPLFLIGFGSDIETAGLRELALQAGGRFNLVSIDKDLAAECQKLVRRLSSHYSIEYVRAGMPGRGFQICVKAPQGSGELSLSRPAHIPREAEPAEGK